MPAPVVALFPPTVTFTAATSPTNSFLGTVTVSLGSTVGSTGTAAPITSVSELTSNAAFGGDIVNITPGPGGVFGSDVYAISRGAGGNTSAINRPGVIYRVNPATGKTSVFFDLNTVLSQTDPINSSTTTPAANSLGASTGLVNWYSMSFDPEGTFDGTPSLFVSSVDRSDPNKNIIFQISPSGTLIGVFVQMSVGLSSLNLTLNPTAILIPPVQDQSFLRGMIAGNGISSTNQTGSGTFAALYFDASSYAPGQVISNATLPTGVSQTELGTPIVSPALTGATTVGSDIVNTGPIIGLTASNAAYGNQVFSVFTDFGTPAGGGIPARPGYSGIQGSDGNLLIGNLNGPTVGTALGNGTTLTDSLPAALTPFRRFYGIAFDQYGYFSQGVAISSTTTGTTGGTTFTLGSNGPLYAGSLFVSDLSSGLYVTVTPQAPLPTTPILVPVQGSGAISVTTDSAGNVIPIISGGSTTGGINTFGGRILRYTPEGTPNVFAYGFDTSGAQDASSFVDSTLSIGFSADGTILYASDNEGIWQFKTTADLADSTSGSLIGLSDLRTLGVPYDGQNQAVAVVDTGVDAAATSFRGRVATGTNIVTQGPGNVDLSAAAGPTSSGGTGGTGGAGGGGTGGGGTGGTTNQVISNTLAGHGTPVAGVVSQFVPDATIVPVNIFDPFFGQVSYSLGTTGTSGTGTGGTGAGGTGGGGTGTGGGTIITNASTSAQYVYDGLQYLIDHPFVNDPIRPGQVDRVIASVYAWGTPFTFPSEQAAYKQFPQVVISFKNQFHKLRKEGIANIAAAGEFGAPIYASSSSTGTGGAGGVGGAGGTTNTIINRADNNAQNSSVGDVKGMSLPAVINEVISVTGTYSFPFTLTPSTSPIDTPTGVIPQVPGPILLFGNQAIIGGTASSGTTGGTGGAGGAGGTTGTAGSYLYNVNLLAAGDINIWSDRIPASVNRSITTDFAAPAFNVPTFSRPFTSAQASAATSGTGGTGGGGGQAGGGGAGGGGTATSTTGGFTPNPLTFDQVGTSMSAAITTGSYALISSALNYWTGLATSDGVTADAYLNSRVGTDTLNFGTHAFKNLEAYNTPDGINGILAWTAVPATDVNSNNTVSTPYQLPHSTAFASFARVSVGNAIASIEGTEAINYLTKHHDWRYIDTNHDGLVTAQELQTFTDDAASMGMPEAGAMASLLGGTATTGPVEPGVNNELFNENPDQPGAQQRRFNYFDYAADGQLNGSISINELRMLGHTLLPSPDAYTIVDRQRASANGFLLAPATPRNFTAIKWYQPNYLWIPKDQVQRYRHITPAQFKVDYNQKSGFALPAFTLFSPTQQSNSVSSGSSPGLQQVVGYTRFAKVGNQTVTVDFMNNTTTASPATSATTNATNTPGASTSNATSAGGSTGGSAAAASTPQAVNPTGGIGSLTSSQATTGVQPANLVPTPTGGQTATSGQAATGGQGTPATGVSNPTPGTGPQSTASTLEAAAGSSGSPNVAGAAATAATGTPPPPASSPTGPATSPATQATSMPGTQATPATASTGSSASPTSSTPTKATASSGSQQPATGSTPAATGSTPAATGSTPAATGSTPAPAQAATGSTSQPASSSKTLQTTTPSPTGVATAQNTSPAIERVAVQNYLATQKKPSSATKLWNNVKSTLGIK